MGQDAETMPLGIEQNNHLSNLTLDVWRDQIFFSKKGRRRILRLPPMPASRVKTSGYTYGSCSWQKLRNSPSFRRLYPLVFLPGVRRHGVCAADQLSCADAALQRPQRSRKGIQECHTKTETAPPRGAWPVAGYPEDASEGAERSDGGVQLLHAAEGLDKITAEL